MLTHVILFKWTDPTPELNDRALQLMHDMAGKIPGLLSVTAGADVVRSTRSYDLALITTHPDLHALKAYVTHPVHRAVSDFVRPHARTMVTVDFTVPEEPAHGQ